MFGIPLHELLWLAAALAVAGVITGVLAGLFGVGGGAIIVPVLYQVFTVLDVPEAVRMPLSIGTSLAIIIPVCIAAYRAHREKGAVDEPILRQWALPCFLGVAAGSLIAAFAPPWLFKLVFVAIAGGNGILLLIGRRDWQLMQGLPAPWPMRAIGFLIGIFSALMGISGGMLSNLIILTFGRTMQQAVATSSGLGIVISIPGTAGYMLAGWSKMALLPPLSIGFVSLIGLVLLAPLSMLFAPLGVRLAHTISKRRLEIAFGLYLLVVAARFVINLI
ncbi:MAG TPA: sulfite exporter TauE/SafE family protein [Xanthobacteraceae bacterium]|nr:sulfite exporter TauE/SafE family protein [Xanthobacteraceae bacterium]